MASPFLCYPVIHKCQVEKIPDKKKTVEPLNKKTHYKRRVYNCFSLKLHKNISSQLITRRNQRQEINKKNESVSLSTKLGNYMLLCVKEKL